MTRRPWPAAALAMGILMSAGAAGCDAATDVQDACPLLGPGSLGDFETLDIPAAAWSAPGDVQHATVEVGSLVLVPFLSDGDETISFELNSSSSAAVFAWGPRDTFGGYPHCLALGRGRASFKATAEGEYLIGIGPWAGDDAPIAANSLDWTVARSGDAAPAKCTTLAAQGCANARCDGELARDADGCLTCECLDGALCGPERSAGPAGSCILPACRCDDLSGGPVCGADGATWPSACDAACAGVAVLKDGPCEAACPSLAACETACFGLREVDGTTGCPTCACLGTFAQNAASCGACPLDPEPVCGSDGRTWPNRCHARCAGARIIYAGSCNPTCRTAPDGCALDCALGLLPTTAPDAGHCLECRCAAASALDCAAFGANACAVVGGDAWSVTTPNACVAAAIGATAGVWGACAVGCEADGDCQAYPAPEDDAWTSTDLRCLEDGFFGGRCFTNDFARDDCGCGALLDPVCGVDDHTYLNLCRLRCLGVKLAHLGACCEASDPPCPDGEVPDRDARGCAYPDGRCLATADAAAGRACAGNAAVAPACTRDGARVTGSACEAALIGLDARPEFCR